MSKQSGLDRAVSVWSTPRLWPGERIVCAAAGPSLRQEDLERVRGRARVIVINWIWHWAPWADCLYAADRDWWASDEAPGSEEGPALKIGLQDRRGREQRSDVRLLHYLPGREGMTGLTEDPSRLQTGQNSGHQAINLGAHFIGAGGEIVLLGYDMKFDGDRRHCHPDHTGVLDNPTEVGPGGKPGSIPKWRMWAETIPPAAEAMGVSIINASRDTSLTCFPRRSIEDLFP